jgi:hypothetical protein
MKKLIVTLDNQNGSLVDMTAEEITVIEQGQADVKTSKEAEETAKQADATNKASGNQKLLDLGLTQAEATALTGYTPPSED